MQYLNRYVNGKILPFYHIPIITVKLSEAQRRQNRRSQSGDIKDAPRTDTSMGCIEVRPSHFNHKLPQKNKFFSKHTFLFLLLLFSFLLPVFNCAYLLPFSSTNCSSHTSQFIESPPFIFLYRYKFSIFNFIFFK